MKAQRKIGSYCIMNSIDIGNKEVVIASNEKGSSDARFLVCDIERNSIEEHFKNAWGCDNLAEALQLYGQHICDAAKVLQEELSEALAIAGANAMLQKKDVIPIRWESSLKGQIVVVAGDALKPEYRYATWQLMLCTGGFGANSKPSGTTCYCQRLYDGVCDRYSRRELIGTISRDALPEWAKEKLKKMEEKC